jgi:hypothetical protein
MPPMCIDQPAARSSAAHAVAVGRERPRHVMPPMCIDEPATRSSVAHAVAVGLERPRHVMPPMCIGLGDVVSARHMCISPSRPG